MPMSEPLNPAELTDDEVLLVSKDLARTLGTNPTVSEMFRMANAQKPEHRIPTLRKAIQGVLRNHGDELRRMGAA